MILSNRLQKSTNKLREIVALTIVFFLTIGVLIVPIAINHVFLNDELTQTPILNDQNQVEEDQKIEQAREIVEENLPSLLNHFQENIGQLENNEVRFYFKQQYFGAGFTDTGVIFRIKQPTSDQQNASTPADSLSDLNISPAKQEYNEKVFILRFSGANVVQPQGRGLLSSKNSYLKGNDPSKWISGVGSFSEVVYQDLYDGIDLIYRFKNGELKYEFLVSPGVSPDIIKLRYEGIEGLSLGDDNSLLIHTTLGTLADKDLFIYQDDGGSLKTVRGTFSLQEESSFRFRITDGYLHNLPLVIDPTLVLITPVNGSVQSGGTLVQLDGTDDNGTLWYSWDGAANSSISAPVCGTTFTGKMTGFNYQKGIAFNNSDFLYVVDRSNNRIRAYYPNGTFLTQWGSFGSGDLQFNMPWGIAINSTGHVIISDWGNAQIKIFDANGNFLSKIGSFGSGNGQFNQPSGIAINATGFYYITDSSNHRIQIFYPNGTFLKKIGSLGSGDGNFTGPMALAFNSTGYLYVVDTGNTRMQVFYSNGTFLKKWGGLDPTPIGIAIDNFGYVYVTSQFGDRVQVFDANGNSKFTWGSTGTGDGQFQTLDGIAFNSTGYIFVSDSENSRIQIFKLNFCSIDLNLPTASGFHTLDAYVVDFAGNWNHGYFVLSTLDEISPSVTNVYRETSWSPTSEEQVRINATVTDDVAVQTVFLNYTLNEGTTWQSTQMVLDSEYTTTIGPFPAGSIVGYFVWANDTTGNSVTSPSGAPGAFYNFSVVSESLNFSTFIGGTLSDRGWDIATDSSNNIYITGYTSSVDFPTTPGANDTTHNNWDVIVSKLSSDGSSLLYSTFIGGDSSDFGWGIVVDSTNNAYVTGDTNSANFPTTPGAYNTTYNFGDIFVVKLSSDGSTLLYSTFVGGSDYDNGFSIALDYNKNAYVTGYTQSFDFPTTPGAYNRTFSGTDDVFVFKISSDGSLLMTSTYIGGSNTEIAYGIAVDSAGNTFITGNTFSSNFPTTPGAYDIILNGNTDVFVSKLDSNGSSLLFSTFVGGNSDERGWGIALDSNQDVYITGEVGSGDYPTTAGAFDTTYNGGGRDAFITKLSSDGSSLLYSTFVGGSTGDEELGRDITIDNGNNAYITGYTQAPDFPTTSGASDPTYNGNYDVFVSKISSDGSSLLYSTFLGGITQDFGRGITLDSKNNPIILGITRAVEFPTTPGAFNTTYNGGDYDLFILSLDITPPIITLITPTNGTTQKGGTLVQLNVTEHNGTVWTSWDSAINSTVSASIVNLGLPLGDGVHTLDTYAVDTVGNWIHKYFEIMTDATPPNLELMNPANGTIHQSGIQVQLNITDSNRTVWYSWNGAANSTTFIPCCSYGYLNQWGSLGTGDGQFTNLFGIAVNSSGYIYVSEDINHRIQVFDANGNFVNKWGSFGSGIGQFNEPTGIAINATGYVYVAEFGNSRVQVFDANGNFVTGWGTLGTGDGNFTGPSGIAINASGYVYVADEIDNRIQVFDANGIFITKWGAFGSEDGNFSSPIGVAINSSGFVYVIDRSNHRIQIFDSNGNFITKWGSQGSGDGYFSSPYMVDIDLSGYVYVSDYGNRRIQVFDATGNFITKWGSLGTGDGQFDRPIGVAINPAGYVYVVERLGNERIQVFEPLSFCPINILSPPGDGIHTLDVYTVDSFENWNHSYFEFTVDATSPNISNVSRVPSWSPTSEEQVIINATITDNFAVHTAFLYYTLNKGATWQSTQMVLASNYSASIGPFSVGTIVGFYIWANDTTGNSVTNPLGAPGNFYNFSVVSYALTYSTFVGGSKPDRGMAITIDDANDIYITGFTDSANFPTTPGANDTTLALTDIFVIKLSSDGSSILYSTFVGGPATDTTYAITVDNGKNAYIAGEAWFSGFPTTPGAFNSSWSGGIDVVIFKLSPDGSTLLYSTYVGGIDNDRSRSIALDTSNNAYVTGHTMSSNFPTTSGAYNETHGSQRDAFVLKLSSDGSSLIYSTLIGGNSQDYSFGVTINNANNAFITGYTDSSNFPTTPGAYDTTPNSGYDVFVSRLSSDGSTLLNSTLFGGSGNDYGHNIVLDRENNTYITGYTQSSNFPITLGAYDTTFNFGSSDAFIFKLSSNGSSLFYSTYVGGNDRDTGWDIDIDNYSNAYIAGYTESSDFPVTSGSNDPTYNGNKDVYVCKISSDGSSLLYSSFFGGSYADWSENGIALDNASNLHIVGYTTSSDMPTTSGVYNITYGGGPYDVFVFSLDITPPTISLITPTNGTTLKGGTLVQLNVTDHNGTVWYSWDGTVNSSISAAIVNLGLPLGDGVHTLDAYAVDDAGNWIHMFFEFVTDATPPSSNSPQDFISENGSSASIRWILNDNFAPGSYDVFRNDTLVYFGTWNNSVDLVISVNTTQIGMWNYTIQFNDSLGNYGSPDRVWVFIMTELPPNITNVIHTPQNPTNVNPILITASITDHTGVDTVFVYYSNNSGISWQSLQMIPGPTYSVNIGTFSIGDNVTYYIWANDTNGVSAKNPLTAPVTSFNFSVVMVTDMTPPTLDLVTPINETVQQSGTLIQLNMTDHNGTLWYSWDGTANLTSTGELVNLTLPTGDGLHTLSAYAVDDSLNWAHKYYEFTTDDLGPSIQLISPENGTIHNSNTLVQLEVTGSDGVVWFSWDGVFNLTTSAPTANLYLRGGDGNHTLDVYAKDGIGNWNHKYFEFVTDDTPPNITILTPTNNSMTNIATYTVEVSTDAFSATTYINGTSYGTKSSDFNWTVTLTAGSNNVTVFAIDEAGNTAQVTHFVGLDTNKPIVSIISPRDNLIVEQSVSSIVVEWQVSDESPINRSEVFLDDILITNVYGLTSTKIQLYLNTGEHQIRVVVWDAAGNHETASITIITKTPVATFAEGTPDLTTSAIGVGTVAVVASGAILLQRRRSSK